MDVFEGSWVRAFGGVFRVAVVSLLLAHPAVAGADEVKDAQARELYLKGKDAFEKHDYQIALDLFKKTFLLSAKSELLFNMASSLQELGRPHEAAEELRAYLRATPEDPDRPSIEKRILALEEQQRVIDGDKPAPAPAPVSSPPAQPDLIVAPPAQAAPSSNRGAIIGVTVGAAVLVIGGVVVLGVVLSSGPEPYETTPLGIHAGTL